jgi:hypothetical protein
VKKTLVFVFSFFLFIVCAQAQTSSDDVIQAYENALKTYGDAVQDLQRADLRSQKRNIVKKTISLNPEQSRAFWPVYDKNEQEVKKINDTRLALITEYRNSLTNIPPEKAADLINRWMQIQLQRNEQKRAYVRELAKVLSSKQALRLLLLENQIDLQIDAQIAAQIPLSAG